MVPPMDVHFDGPIVNSRFDATARRNDTSGYPIVMSPTSPEDVATAVKVKVLTGSKMIVSSGIHSTTNDVPKVGTGAIVVDMRYLKGIKEVADLDRCLDVEVATTLAELGAFLVGKDECFLPLGDNLSKSVVSTVLSGDAGLYVRSQGLLKDCVKKIYFINDVGEQKFSTNIDELANLKEHVITSFEFQCKVNLDSMRCIRFYIPYTEEVFNKLIEKVLQQSPSHDLHILVRKDVYGIPFVCATVACNRDFDDDDCIVNYLTNCENVTMRESKGAKEVVKASLEAGFSGGLEYYNLDCTMHARELTLEGDSFCNLIEAAFGNDKHDIFCPDVEMIAGVRLTATGGVEAQTCLYMAKEISERELRLKQFVELVMVPPASSGVPPEASLPPSFDTVKTYSKYLRSESKSERKLFELVADQFKISVPTHGLNEAPPIRLENILKRDPVPAPIPDFVGKVYMQKDREYAASIHQYASSSYPDPEDQKRMLPHMAAYPLDTKDVIAAILYATAVNKKIVSRSGGHQYCGLSSGGDDTILLIMEEFNKLEVRGNIAVVGPGCRLVDIAKAFKQAGVTIPHGECPLVCIGGHVQTGGYGHLLRSFGLALDHVKSFDMVLSNGTLKTFSRGDLLYWAVLGGGPGSFGVITEIRFECIMDVDHPKSFGYNGVFNFDKDVFNRAMREVQNWTREINDPAASFPEDVDLMVSATSHSWNPLRPLPVMLLEMVHGNFKGMNQTEEETNRARTVFNHTLENVKTKPLALLRDAKNHSPLSDLSDSFVRRVGLGTTLLGDQGREFSFPYLKRLNVFEKPLTESFVNSFTELINDVITDRDRDNIKLVFQMVLGGGQVRKLGEQSITSISCRNYTIGIVFDIFYNNEKSGMKDKADAFQKRMGELIDKEFKGEREIRMHWGSFGNTNMDEVWPYYYDDKTHYGMLQKIKRETDPGDLFHTSFTVQLPPAGLESQRRRLHGDSDGSGGIKKRKLVDM
jgi:FAD/FMN-containing dehydrogenase